MIATTTSLQDKYVKRDGRVVITGVQALVRLMLLQVERDRRAGLHTGAFVSGYRGSPLGTLDLAFAAAGKLVQENGIVLKTAINEEMAATAVAGTQQIAQSPGARVEGVASLWYGKGPGLDRASDAIRHGNFQGSSPRGGVVLAVGDDHLAKSSSIVCCSDDTVVSLQVPYFYPSDPREIVLFGLHAFALSRHTGSWAALKIITEVADSTRSVPADELDGPFVLPTVASPPGGLHNRWPEMPLEQEARQQNHRLPAALAYVRANGLDRILAKTPRSRIGLVSAGKSWLDLREALRLLGLDDDRLAELGIALYKPALIWPLEPQSLSEFASGLETLVVVEEKGALVEGQIKAALVNLNVRPRIFGKAGPDGSPLFPKTGDLTPELVAAELGAVLGGLTGDAALQGRLQQAQSFIATQEALAVPPVIRRPFFCSGCPHNRSTVLPEGSRATAGIGCHGLAAYNRPATTSFSQMGGEGIHWMGLSPFTDEKHMFANLGDGTYFHSGLLAIRQAVAARLNITYKLLFNGAVAMTGGQAVDGELSVKDVVDQLRAEGVGTVVICTDDPTRYAAGTASHAENLRVVHRDDLDGLQRELREVEGVSVIVYEQMCATEKRRLRKRGRLADPATRVFVNEAVCEGCGDCSVKSNCLSVEPVTTPFGTKRRINQSSCNKDLSCLNGFCPSFVTVEGAARTARTGVPKPPPAVPMPPERRAADHQRIVVAGIGGTGVVTIGALLSMAGFLEGVDVAVLDQVGMAQKGGAVTSHVHMARDGIGALRIPAGQADLVLVCDQIVGNMRDVMAGIDPEKTFVVVNGDTAVTGDFTRDRDAVPDGSLLARRLAQRAGPGRFASHPFGRLAERLLGDAIGSNLMMVGFAHQSGSLGLDEAAFEAAVRLNGVGVETNLAAFGWGRQLAVAPDMVYRAADLAADEPESVDAAIERRAGFLEAYQDRAYAARYRSVVDRVRAAEARVGGGSNLTRTAAEGLFRLMAYKDEYEVARLHADPAFTAGLRSQFEGPVEIAFHLAPPMFARRDPTTGEPRKIRFGGWMIHVFRLLAGLRRLRGTRLDPFGRTEERRTERALITDYEALLSELLRDLSPRTLPKAIAIAGLVAQVRGFGHVKAQAIAGYREAVERELGDRSDAETVSVEATRSA